MISFFTRHPTAANLAMALFLFIGAMTLPKLNRETFPDFRPSEVEIRVVYPGATPEDIEFAVCQRIEDAADGIVGVEELRSEALDNTARVVIKMKEGGDFQQFTSEVRAEVEAIDDFPDLAEDPVIRQLGKKDRVLSVAVTGNMSAPDLKAYCEDLKTRMLRDDNISIVDIEGFSQHQMLIEIPSFQAAKFGLSVQQIARAISSQSFDQPAGQLKTKEKDIVLRFTEERRTTAEIEDLIIFASSDGAELRLGDVAKVTDVFASAEDKIEVNSVRAGMLRIKKTKDQDCLEVNDAVRAFFAEEDKIKLAGIEFTMTEDLTSIVRDRLQMLIINGLQGLLLVFIVMWLFFGLKFSFWVSMGLPVAFMGSFFFLPIFGATINMLTMVALLLALGLLMDDAIVIAENVATRFQNGDSAVDAAANGTKQVSIGVFSSFVTTLGVFLPLAFLEGNIGKVLKVVPVVLILVLAVSLVEAFLILPNHLSHSLTRAPASPFRRRFDAFIEWIRETVVGGVVDWTTRWRYLVLGMVIAVFILAVSMLAGGIVKFQGFPDIEGDVVVCRVLLPQGTTIERTEETVKRLVSTLEEVNQELSPDQPDGQALILNKVVQFNINTDAQERGAHVATISADLLSSEIRKTTIDTLLSNWRAKIGVLPDVIQLKFAEPNFGPAGRPIDIRLQGESFENLKKASYDLQSYLSSYTGVLDLSDDMRPGKPQERFKLAAGAKSLGVDARMIAEQLRAAYQGLTARQVQVQTEDYDIEVRTADFDRDSFADLDNFQVTLADGQQVPLSQLVVQSSDRGWARIHRINGRRTV
ncbi:MAG: efflux RND transporter permease subunit, partial [Planctomycetota bacterium]|nr:efflux RND transporter permease subunit [Planctomycetota bacterium]